MCIHVYESQYQEGQTFLGIVSDEERCATHFLQKLAEGRPSMSVVQDVGD